jgi:hypothetical protein
MAGMESGPATRGALSPALAAAGSCGSVRVITGVMIPLSLTGARKPYFMIPLSLTGARRPYSGDQQTATKAGMVRHSCR